MPFAAIFSICAALSQAPTDAMELDAARRLSAAWSRAAVAMIAEPRSPGAQSFAGAIELALAAAELMPNDPQGWRTVVDLAEVADMDEPAVAAAYGKALKSLSQLDPSDESVRLARVVSAVERNPTADDRLKAFERLLTPESRKTLGAPVAARIAFDLALLEQRRGVTAGWKKWLRESTVIDPSFPLAAETYAGVVAGSETPLPEVAEALVRSIVADPGSVPSLSALSRICLHEGLYEEADRLLAIAVRVTDENVDMNLVDDLLADRLLALWGSGRVEDALKAFDMRRRQVNAMLRQRTGDAGATAADSDQTAGPQVGLPTALSSVWVAIMASRELSPSGVFPAEKETERKKLDDALQYVLSGLKLERDALPSPEAKAANDLEQAWIQSTVGDPAMVEDLLASAQAVTPMSDEALARFNGWVRLRRTDYQTALDLLQPIAAKDPAARVGAAMALAGLGRKRDAAREFLAVLRENRDNVVGLFAADRLHGLIAKRAGAEEGSAQIRQVVQRIPAAVYELSTSPSKTLRSSVVFGGERGALDAVPLRVTIQNRSGLPLEIAPDGPIESKIAIRLEVSVIGNRRPSPISPSIVAIDRQLLLKPSESITLDLDLSRTPLGSILLQHPLDGLLIEARAITNFRLTTTVVKPGFLGGQSEAVVLRVPAVQITPSWREDAIGEIRNPDRAEDVVKLVQLAHALAKQGAQADANEKVKSADDANDTAAEASTDKVADDPAAERERIRQGWAAVQEGWKKLPPLAQAWALMALPSGDSLAADLAPILEVAKVSRSEPVRISYLIRWVTSPDDTQFEAASRQGGRIGVVSSGSQALRRAITLDAADSNQDSDDVGVLGGGGSPEGGG